MLFRINVDQFTIYLCWMLMIIEPALRCLLCMFMPTIASIQAKVIFHETKIQFNFNENSDSDDNFAIFSNQGDSNCIRKHALLPTLNSLNADIECLSLCHCCLWRENVRTKETLVTIPPHILTQSDFVIPILSLQQQLFVSCNTFCVGWWDYVVILWMRASVSRLIIKTYYFLFIL